MDIFLRFARESTEPQLWRQQAAFSGAVRTPRQTNVNDGGGIAGVGDHT
jgi:hypothetical protein